MNVSDIKEWFTAALDGFGKPDCVGADARRLAIWSLRRARWEPARRIPVLNPLLAF
jgi:hypothetical protein